MTLLIFIIIFSSVSLSTYGLSCFCSQHMVDEFERYGLPQFRMLVGTLEFFGGLGLLVGLYFPWLGFCAASGLAILLLCGFVVRIKIRDSILKSLPALSYFFINAYLAFIFFEKTQETLT